MANHDFSGWTVVLVHVGCPHSSIFVTACRRGFAPFGLRVLDFAVSQPDRMAEAARLVNDPAEKVLCVLTNHLACLMHPAGERHLTLNRRVPILSLLGDGPGEFRRRGVDLLPPGIENVILLPFSQEWADLWSSCVSSRNPIRLVNTSILSPYLSQVQSYEDYLDRADEAICAFNFTHVVPPNDTYDADAFAGRLAGTPDIRDFVWRAIELCETDVGLTPLAAIRRIEANAEESLPAELILEVHWYANVLNKLRKRRRLFDALLDSPVVFCGSGFPPSLVAAHPERFSSQTFPDLAKRIARTRFLIDPPCLTDTVHDRVMTALATGCVPIVPEDASINGIFDGTLRPASYDFPHEMADTVLRRLRETPRTGYEAMRAAAEVGGAKELFQTNFRIILEAAQDAREARDDSLERVC